MVDVKRWDTGAVICSGPTIKEAVENAVCDGVILYRANLTGADLSRAYLTGANLTDANLARANLARANLTGAYLTDAYLTDAYLTDAYLTGADLSRAYLTGANLTDAYLTGANLTDANLARANLARANLVNTILESLPTVYEWARDHNLPMWTINNRTLVMGWRSQNQPVMGGPDYEIGKVYVAEPFSRDPVTSCHPGRYVSHEGDMAVAFWLDEALVAGTAAEYKVRCKKLRTLCLRDGEDVPLTVFGAVTEQDMEPNQEGEHNG